MRGFRRTLGAVSLFLMVGNAAGVEIEFLSGPKISSADIPTDCTLLLSTIGYGHPYVEIEAYVAASSLISEATLYSLGKEGEFTLCLRIERSSAARQVFEDLKTMLPRNLPVQVALSLWGGPSFWNVWRGETYSTYDLE